MIEAKAAKDTPASPRGNGKASASSKSLNNGKQSTLKVPPQSVEKSGHNTRKGSPAPPTKETPK
jgi:hypothetical protein